MNETKQNEPETIEVEAVEVSPGEDKETAAFEALLVELAEDADEETAIEHLDVETFRRMRSGS